MFCWGRGDNGQLGDGNYANSSTLVSVTGMFSGVTKISCGHDYTCAVTATGALYCWGSNWSGALEDGTTIDRSLPQQVFSSGVSSVVAGRDQTCAIKSDG
jgi:alpha-tubulin suppressor-like RCC1 family protein